MQELNEKQPVKTPYLLFCCYARKDQGFLLELKAHLSSLEREGLLRLEDDIDISPGMPWETTLTNYLEKADIILLLISPDFIASNYCYEKEMLRALERHAEGTARIVPVIVRPAFWHNMPFGKLQALPKDAAPISTAKDRDTAFLSVVKGMRLVIRELQTGVRVPELAIKALQSAPDQAQSSPLEGEERITMDKRDRHEKNIGVNKGTTIHGNQINSEKNDVVSTGDNATIIYGSDKAKDGLKALKNGAEALKKRDYQFAQRTLKVAVHEIPPEQHPEEAAQARYLLALADLGSELPRFRNDDTIELLEDLMRAALQWDTLSSYYWFLAVMQEDYFSANGLRSRLGEVARLEQQAMRIPWNDAIDTPNIQYLQLCQPELFGKFAAKTGWNR